MHMVFSPVPNNWIHMVIKIAVEQNQCACEISLANKSTLKQWCSFPCYNIQDNTLQMLKCREVTPFFFYTDLLHNNFLNTQRSYIKECVWVSKLYLFKMRAGARGSRCYVMRGGEGRKESEREKWRVTGMLEGYLILKEWTSEKAVSEWTWMNSRVLGHLKTCNLPSTPFDFSWKIF